MTAQHTPGPWKFSFESVDPEWAVITTSGGAVVANVNANHRQEANAALIAAAPDMVDALYNAHNYFCMIRGVIAALPKRDGACAMIECHDSAVEIIMAAIARAEGRA